MIISPRLSHTFFPLLSDNDFRWKGMNKNQELKQISWQRQFHNWSDLMLQCASNICCLKFFYLIHIESIVRCLLLRRTIATGLVVGTVRIGNVGNINLNADKLNPIVLRKPQLLQKITPLEKWSKVTHLFLTRFCRNSWQTYCVLW